MSQSAESVTQTFGNFSRDLLTKNQCLLIDFAAGLVPQRQFWPNSSLSAKFVADYLMLFFPANADEPQKVKQQTEIRDTVRYIINELLENAVKFSNHASPIPPQLGLHIHPGKIVVFVRNSSSIDCLPDFRSLIHELTTVEPVTLYIDRLEKNLDSQNSHRSGLGFITILSNYETQMGWQFEPIASNPEAVLVTTMVQLLYDWNIWTDCLKSTFAGMRHGN